MTLTVHLQCNCLPLCLLCGSGMKRRREVKVRNNDSLYAVCGCVVRDGEGCKRAVIWILGMGEKQQ